MDDVNKMSNEGFELAKKHTYDIRAKKLISAYRELVWNDCVSTTT